MPKSTSTTAAERLSTFIKSAVSPFHTVEESAKLLKKAGFSELDPLGSSGKWKLSAGGKYYVIPYKTALFAFTIPGANKKRGLHIAAAHTDFPCLHVKPRAELESGGYMRVNTEVYGGPILNTWLDRPLSLAGRVILRSNDIYAPHEVLLDIKKPILTIPNLAVHYNREVNDGVKLSKQNDMLPIMGMINDAFNKDSYFIDFIANEIKEERENILDCDLYVYNAEEPRFVGISGDMLSSPRLDNITSCLALTEGIIDPEDEGGIDLIALFDNEEIGSMTKQGADSALLEMQLHRIYEALGKKPADLDEDIRKGFFLSVDVAHALHPAHAGKYDPVNNMRMGDGVTFKLSANQRYTYDSVAVAALQQLCDGKGIRYRKFVNNSDMPGGHTLGPILSSRLPMYTVDIGVPILAMHSAREVMGAADQEELVKLMKAFF
ncbi:MAG: M18 family aminopeptidase [Lachnospiraceae bacterium]|nr:M18 family aminopeptidase [Lachnospiraceae bacterium]